MMRPFVNTQQGPVSSSTGRMGKWGRRLTACGVVVPLVAALGGVCRAGQALGIDPQRKEVVVAMYHLWYPGPTSMEARRNYKDASWLARPINFPADRRLAFTPLVCDRLDYLSAASAGSVPYGYNSTDPSVVRAHCLWAKQARIDAFAVQTMTDDVWFTKDHMPRVVDEMARNRMWWFPLFDEGCTQIENTEAERRRVADWALRCYGKYGRKGWFRIGGKPVLFMYAASRVAGSKISQVRFWSGVRRKIEDRIGPIMMIGLVEDNRAFDIVARYQMFDPNFWKNDDYDGVLKHLEDVWTDLSRSGLISAPTLMPGFKAVWDEFYPWDSSHSWLEPNADFFARMWRMARKIDQHQSPTWFFVTSWNEWWEGTCVEPTRENGERFLEVIRRRGG